MVGNMLGQYEHGGLKRQKDYDHYFFKEDISVVVNDAFLLIGAKVKMGSVNSAHRYVEYKVDNTSVLMDWNPDEICKGTNIFISNNDVADRDSLYRELGRRLA